MQGVLQKLAREVERNIQLNSEVKEGKNSKQSTQTHTQLLSKCGCVLVLGAGEGTGREWSSDRQSGSAENGVLTGRVAHLETEMKRHI